MLHAAGNRKRAQGEHSLDVVLSDGERGRAAVVPPGRLGDAQADDLLGTAPLITCAVEDEASKLFHHLLLHEFARLGAEFLRC
jgi:hypothetical protein